MKSLLLLLCLCPLSAAMADPARLLESLRTELKAQVKAAREAAKTAGKAADSAQGPYMLDSLLLQLPGPDEVSDETLPRILDTLTQMKRITLSDKIDKLCLDLLAEVRARVDKSNTSLKEKYGTTLATALTASLNATKAGDLDAPLKSLAVLKKEVSKAGYRSQSPVSLDSEALQGLEQIVTAIQDGFLAAANPAINKRNGDPGERILSTGTSYGKQLVELMPRSEFLTKLQAVAARVSPPAEPAKPAQAERPATFSPPPAVVDRESAQREAEAQVRSCIGEIKKVEDIAGAILKMEKLADQIRYSGTFAVSGQLDLLRSYQRQYQEYKTGTGKLTGFTPTFISQPAEGMLGVRAMVLKYALVKVLHGPADLVPGEDENVTAYLQRSIDKAREASDWTLMGRAIDSATLLGFTGVDSQALRYFISGQNYEKAQLYSSAVSSYLASIRTGSTVFPVEPAGARLAALKKEHKEDYEHGTQVAEAALDRTIRSGSTRYTPPDPGRAATAAKP